MSTAHEPDADVVGRLHTLQTGGRRLALGVPAATPRLSWKVGAGSGLGPATLHTVVVAADAAALDAGTAIWQTTTDRPFVEYAGPALGSRTRRAWRVIATDGATTVISPVATFETGLTAADDWQANWIRGVADPFRHESFDPAPYLRHEFEPATMPKPRSPTAHRRSVRQCPRPLPPVDQWGRDHRRQPLPARVVRLPHAPSRPMTSERHCDRAAM